jgi:(R)-2-hydroxyacyl-CoA dehydratese activating ATPase
MITLGCDVGSLFTKAVLLKGDDLAAWKVTATTGNIASEIEAFLKATADQAGVARNKIERLAGTGSGADLLPGADLTPDNLTCLAAATAFYLPEVTLAIDVGGQSITSVLLNEDGEMVDFMRNDKCASGSGRFLEVMSAKLNVNTGEIDRVVSQSKKPLDLSAQCGVFAESEVITHVNEGEATADIMAGVAASVANIVVAQARRFGMAEHYTVTGGVALVNSVVKIIREKLSGQYHRFPQNPQLAAAIGAAVLAGSE